MVRNVSNATVNGLQYRVYKNKNGEMVDGYNVYFVFPLTADNDSGYCGGVCYASAGYVKKAGLDIGSPLPVCGVGFGRDFHYEIME